MSMEKTVVGAMETLRCNVVTVDRITDNQITDSIVSEARGKNEGSYYLVPERKALNLLNKNK